MNTNNNTQTMTTEEIIKLGNEQQDEQLKVMNKVIHDLYNFNHTIINKLYSLQEQVKDLQSKLPIKAYVAETDLPKVRSWMDNEYEKIIDEVRNELERPTGINKVYDIPVNGRRLVISLTSQNLK